MGTDIAEIYKWNLNPFSIVEQVAAVLQDDSLFSEEKPKANQLPAISRLLHSILTYNIIPRGGHRDNVTHLDMAVLTHLLTGTPFCLPFLMLQSMNEATTHPQMSLPYGMALTKVFREFGVDLRNESDVEQLNRKTQTINALSLTRMGFSLVNNVYQKVGRGQARVPVHEEGEEEEEAEFEAQTAGDAPQEQAAPMDVPSASSSHQYSINDLYHLMESKFQNIQTSIDRLDARMDKIERHFTPPSSD